MSKQREFEHGGKMYLLVEGKEFDNWCSNCSFQDQKHGCDQMWRHCGDTGYFVPAEQSQAEPVAQPKVSTETQVYTFAGERYTLEHSESGRNVCDNCAFVSEEEGCRVAGNYCGVDGFFIPIVQEKPKAVAQLESIPEHGGIKLDEVRSYHVGNSDYSKHKIQPWDIWLEYNLNPWDADIVKRVLRQKQGDSRQMDYEKIIHICQERIRQLNLKENM